VGCEGASMKVLMNIAKSDGATVSGSDALLNGHRAEFAEGADEVVYSSAVPYENPELAYAREHGIKILSRAEFLGELASRYGTTVAVAGSHGKTTVTAMLGCIFEPLNPTVHLGGEYGGKCGRVGGKKIFVTEACEYKRNFLHLLPKISVVLNVELDHTDYYRDIADITSAFDVFSRSAPVRVLSGDDSASEPLRRGKYITFGLGENCDYRAANASYYRGGAEFTLYRFGKPLGIIKLRVMGKHNVLNALAACAAAMSAGMEYSLIKRGLESFEGAGRRLEFLGSAAGCDVFSDYAHHPHEIESVIECLRSAGYERVGIAFEPHTYTRTQSLMDGFVKSLCGADEILLAEIYAAREQPVAGVSSQVLCRGILDCGRSARVFSQYCELNRSALLVAEKCDALVFCGAGTIDIAARKFAQMQKN